MNEREVHEEVSRAYTEALRRSREGRSNGCCGGGAVDCGAAADLAGYDQEREVYPEAAASSFGFSNADSA